MHKPLKTLVSAAVIGILSTGAAHAAGFSLYTEGSPAAAGNFGAGLAAEAGDASIGWYNPAGLVLIRNQQVVFGGTGIFPSVKLSGFSSFNAAPAPFVQTFNSIGGGENAIIPAVHYALPLGDNATFGLSITAPIGLSTDWGVRSPVRYEATLTEVITSTVSPELGAKITDNFSAGLGLDLQYSRVKFNRIIGLPTLFGNPFIIPPGDPFGSDTLSYNKGNSFGVGFHAGLMGMFNDNHTRIGVNYESKIRHTFHGFSRLTGPLATADANVFVPLSGFGFAYSNDLFSNPVNFPDVVTLSGYHDVNEKVALLGSVVYTGWSTFKTIQLNNVAAPSVNSLTGGLSQVTVNSVSSENYRDAWRASIGANYRFNDMWMLRVGGGYDATPTNNVDRGVRLPDGDRWALAVGAHYQMQPNLGFDLGYTHLFMTNSSVNKTDVLTSTSSYTVNARSHANANLVGAQVVWNIDQPMAVSSK